MPLVINPELCIAMRNYFADFILVLRQTKYIKISKIEGVTCNGCLVLKKMAKRDRIEIWHEAFEN